MVALERKPAEPLREQRTSIAAAATSRSATLTWKSTMF
jgi:hypothetical protein